MVVSIMFHRTLFKTENQTYKRDNADSYDLGTLPQLKMSSLGVSFRKQSQKRPEKHSIFSLS